MKLTYFSPHGINLESFFDFERKGGETTRQIDSDYRLSQV